MSKLPQPQHIHHALSKPSRLSGRLRSFCSFGLIAALSATISCGSALSPKAIPPAPPDTTDDLLTPADINSIVYAAASAINVPLTIAVSDRRGTILAVFSSSGAPAMTIGNFGVSYPADEVAAALARTAAFFSNDQAPIGSRTVRFISGIHFPPGVMNTESAPLYDIESTNRGCGFNTTYLPGQSLPVPTLLHNSNSPGLGILTGKGNLLDSDPNAVNPGGVPIFKNNRVAGGIGVVAALPASPTTTVSSSMLLSPARSSTASLPSFPRREPSS